MGIVVAADLSQEWILPWWWQNFSTHNTLPVAFIDLGMSEEKKRWCQERGELIALRRADFADETVQFGVYATECRNVWFKKPFAFLKSPFETSLWLDIDCEVRGDLTPLFKHTPLAIAKEQWETCAFPLYNSGVVLYKKNEIIQKWADAALTRSKEFPGDQDLLSFLIEEERIKVDELPPEYNWSRRKAENGNALIVHYHGNHGKSIIRHFSRLA